MSDKPPLSQVPPPSSYGPTHIPGELDEVRDRLGRFIYHFKEEVKEEVQTKLRK